VRFVKMHGAGNDYVYIDGFRQTVDDPARWARVLSDRHFGVGGDGLILILPSACADVRMRMFNVDGSEAEMCGNGVRCVAKYAFEQGLTQHNPLTVETGAGVLELTLLPGASGRIERVRVNMGEPRLTWAEIPMAGAGDEAVRVPLEVAGQSFEVTCVSMGNPHCVLYVDDIDQFPLHEIGPLIEHHPLFPRRTNVECVQVLSPGEVRQRTWERGCGETLACGTGACAVTVAGVLTGRTGPQLLNHLRGGDLELEWSGSGPVWMTGPAVQVFEGVYEPG